jgi:hypothetical protein
MSKTSIRAVPARPASCGPEHLRSRIALLLGDPFVAERVRRRIALAEETAARERAGTPPCYRARDDAAFLRTLFGNDRCRTRCRSVDCLCGRYPRALSIEEIDLGRTLEPVAV